MPAYSQWRKFKDFIRSATQPMQSEHLTLLILGSDSATPSFLFFHPSFLYQINCLLLSFTAICVPFNLFLFPGSVPLTWKKPSLFSFVNLNPVITISSHYSIPLQILSYISHVTSCSCDRNIFQIQWAGTRTEQIQNVDCYKKTVLDSLQKVNII